MYVSSCLNVSITYIGLRRATWKTSCARRSEWIIRALILIGVMRFLSDGSLNWMSIPVSMIKPTVLSPSGMMLLTVSWEQLNFSPPIEISSICAVDNLPPGCPTSQDKSARIRRCLLLLRKCCCSSVYEFTCLASDCQASRVALSKCLLCLLTDLKKRELMPRSTKGQAHDPGGSVIEQTYWLSQPDLTTSKFAKTSTTSISFCFY